MSKMVIVAVSALAIITTSGSAFADVGSGTEILDPTKLATMACRPSTGNERPTATVVSVPVVCKSMPGAKLVMRGEGGPDVSKARSAEEVDRKWRDFYTTHLMVLSGDGGG